MMRIALTIDGAFVREVPVEKDMVVGRLESSDIHIPNSEVSSRHARIRPVDGGVVLTDLSSTNGTFINGEKRLDPGTDLRLEPGMRICIGPAVLELRIPREGEKAPPQRETADAHRMFGTMVIGTDDTQSGIVNEAKFRASRPRLLVSGEGEGRTIPLESTVVEVGREGADVNLSHPSVSGKHARISFENGFFVLRDHGSRNGTFVDSLPVSGPTPLGIEAAVTFGTVECLFVQTPPQQTAGEDVPPEVIVRHVVTLGKATGHQGDQVLAEFAKGAKSLGELFVGRGILPPREWIEIYRQRRIIGTLAPVAGRKGMHPMVWLALGLLVATMAVWAAKTWLF